MFKPQKKPRRKYVYDTDEDTDYSAPELDMSKEVRVFREFFMKIILIYQVLKDFGTKITTHPPKPPV